MKNIIYILNKENILFPDPRSAPKDSPLAIGGDLSIKRLINAYKNGIFPWYDNKSPILWWSPDPRFVLFVDNLHISKSLSKLLKKRYFDLTVDNSFEEVITNCAKIKRRNEHGTWITEEMITAYIKMHEMGYAHSIEARKDNKLVGGFYGVSLGSIFFGESMFHTESNASKYAFASFVLALKEKSNIDIIDCQVYTDYLESFGAKFITRNQYLDILKDRINKESKISDWKLLL
ncbi:MAG: leucyl/phenylalanyl-tRNA--protein transferase [Exilispira sp.]